MKELSINTDVLNNFKNILTKFGFSEKLVQTHIIENWEAQDEPEHLKTIRDRLLNDEQRAGSLLALYQQILQGIEVYTDDSPEQIELLLSGLVVKQQRHLSQLRS